MKIKFLAVVLSALFVCTLPPAASAQTLAEIEAKFAADAAQHRRDLDDLYSLRGLSSPKMEDPTVQDIAKYLATQRADNSPGYPAGTAVLFYAHKGDRLAIYLMDTSGILAHHISAVSQLDLRDAAGMYRLEMDVDGIDRSRAPVWQGEDIPAPTFKISTSEHDWESQISDILLPQPIRAKLRDVRHLVVVANGVIATNPFAAFPLNGDELLIDRMSVTVSAGLFDLDQMIRPWGGLKEYNDILLVGDPLVPATPDWSVPRLPGAVKETQLLASRTNTKALIGEYATKVAVVDRMESARMLYFAAHGLSDPRAPLTGGFLMLSGPTPDAAFLTAGEVQRMDLSASIAVLSACQSGLGMEHDGGVIGLARSFQKAGVPRVVMSLWSVSDEATVYLMDRFQLAAMVHMPAEALRLAMLDTRKKYPDPALWAPFTLFGTPR
ncbi:CHAT domain-containing protein [Erythrobacter insulae]|uniref:CHAT domain-containing protein n=1 Tax=Erythrobacter insulae TaxID=2584124 RepID=A0A547P8Y2_9SPHN|nr:CHAT domain-containing protein [Erythrobacter insulae]TRD10514.1 CHAT domain-containing protein [Erythrobacter insulae]